MNNFTFVLSIGLVLGPVLAGLLPALSPFVGLIGGLYFLGLLGIVAAFCLFTKIIPVSARSPRSRFIGAVFVSFILAGILLRIAMLVVGQHSDQLIIKSLALSSRLMASGSVGAALAGILPLLLPFLLTWVTAGVMLYLLHTRTQVFTECRIEASLSRYIVASVVGFGSLVVYYTFAINLWYVVSRYVV